MSHAQLFYIGGEWVAPISPGLIDVIDPSTEEPIARIALGGEADVDRAVAVAKAAFASFSRTSRQDRLALLRRVIEVYNSRYDEIARTLSQEMGAPRKLATEAQAATGTSHLGEMIAVLERFEFEQLKSTTLIAKEPIGVCGLITPWNWPINQIVCKVAPALAAGCTMVLKPSEIAPLNAVLFAEILHEAGVPGGVFNLVNGDGPTVGQAIARHPDIDMVSFTGSTRAGVLVAKAAADTVKRVHQELGGESANILLPDVDLQRAVTRGVIGCFRNSGQSCSADAHVRARNAARRSGGDRQASRRAAQGRPSRCGRYRAGAGRESGAVRQDPASDCFRDRGGCFGGRRPAGRRHL
jgi:aldehyde dehydrogenase (NAD+)